MNDELEFLIVNDFDNDEYNDFMDKVLSIKNKEIIEYRNKKKRNNSIINSLYGFIVGDAFGVPFEFETRENMKNINIGEMIGFKKHNKPAGTWSDDTSMTLATIDSINDTLDINYEDLMVRYCSWLLNNNYTSDGKVFDVGITTNKAIKLYVNTNLEATKCGSLGLKENGNGSLMRMMPVCFYLIHSNYGEDEIVNIINNFSSMTHAHEISRLGCFIYYYYMKNILMGHDKETAYQKMCSFDYSKYYSLNSIDYYKRLLSKKIKDEKKEKIQSSGFIVDTIEAVIWTILNTENFKSSIIESVNLGGDTDTIGAITGSIAGILYGYENIPVEWIEKIPKKEYLNSLISKFDNEILLNHDRIIDNEYKKI